MNQMSNGMNVFSVPEVMTDEKFAKIVSVLEAKLDPNLIKKRKQGNTELSYIGGHTVIRMLNEAFSYRWSYEIVTEEIVPSLPKVNKYAKPGEGPEPQPPVAKVLGRLTVPGLGVKEQYGSKVIIGGATEQEASFKSASTDALKKCATLFGIGLELYDDDTIPENTSTGGSGYQGKPSSPAAPSKPATPQASAQSTPASSSWDSADIARLKELKKILGIPEKENNKLDSYVREFLDDQSADYRRVNPANVKAFNIFLTKKAEQA
jgi:recombination DNA repair RAD52 pathway protein